MDERLRVTAWGVVHKADCPHLKRSATRLPWTKGNRVHGDRACLHCQPTIAADLSDAGGRVEP